MWHYIVMALGWIIKTIYELVQNYGLAIILFTIVVKLLLLPLNIKSQRAMKKQAKLQPVLAELQKKYANDQQKLQQETMKLYKDNNVSMMGGCLPMLIQMPILIALYQAIQKPLTYMFNVPYKAKDLALAENAWVVEKVTELKDAAVAAGANVTSSIEQLLNIDQITISSWAGKFGGEAHDWFINFNFLGMDLSQKPQAAMGYLADPVNNWGMLLLLLIPILAIVSSVAQSKISMKLSGQSNNNEQTQSMNKMMTWMMPLMTGYFTLILPAGIGIYWIVSGVLQIVQQLALNLYFDKKGEDFVVKVPEKKNQHGKKSKKH